MEKGKCVPIKGLSNIRRLPRLGVIKLGMKNERNLPVALDYFLCPGEVREVYNEKPRALDIRFALENSDDIFPQFYKLYGSSAGLKAYSDGVKLWTKGNEPGEWNESPAPTKEDLIAAGFKATGTLSFVLPKVSYAGIYQVTTRSFHSIVKLNSSIDYIRQLFGRVQGLPLKLELESQEAYIQINGKPAKKTVWTMKLNFDMEEVKAFWAGKQKALGEMKAPTAMLQTETESMSVVDEDEDEDEDEELGEGIHRSDLPA